jgi:hypothetical protein
MSTDDYRAVLLRGDQHPSLIICALRGEVGLSDFDLGEALDAVPVIVRRWRKAGVSAEIPVKTVAAIENLHLITEMFIRAGEKKSIKSFLLSRNTGLGGDRPLDGLSRGDEAFRLMKYVTQCYLAWIAPEEGPRLPVRAELSWETFERMRGRSRH